ncbi:MAG TPA: hypothetical protein VF576_00645 [Rubricoccaceae bacterium]
MASLCSRRAALFFAALLGAIPSLGVAQELPAAGVFFDDFMYARADAPPEGGLGVPYVASANQLFGLNEWCRDLRCTRDQKVMVRAWYWYNYFEHFFQDVDPLSRLTASRSNGGTLDFTLLEGIHDLHPDSGVSNDKPREISTGFAAPTGVWAAQVDFSDLPDGRPSGVPSQMMQSFWTHSPNEAILTPTLTDSVSAGPKGWTELDFEFNNWFWDDGRSRYMATGYFENHQDPDGDGYPSNTMPLQAPYRPGSGPIAKYSCLIEVEYPSRPSRPPTYEGVANNPNRCESILAGTDPEAGPNVPTTMIIRAQGHRVRFELAATWSSGTSTGSVTMETPWFTGEIQPSQLATMHLSFYLAPPNDSPYLVPSEQRMRADWTYFTPDTGRSLDQVLRDVALIRRHGVERLYTVPGTNAEAEAALNRPYRRWAPGDPQPSWEGLTATEPLTITAVEGPQSIPVGSQRNYVAVINRRAGDYLYEWRQTPVYTDDTFGTPTPYVSTAGFRWGTSGRGYQRPTKCLKIELRVTRHLHNFPDSALGWQALTLQASATPSAARERAETSFYACTPGHSPPPVDPGRSVVP